MLYIKATSKGSINSAKKLIHLYLRKYLQDLKKKSRIDTEEWTFQYLSKEILSQFCLPQILLWQPNIKPTISLNLTYLHPLPLDVA